MLIAPLTAGPVLALTDSIPARYRAVLTLVSLCERLVSLLTVKPNVTPHANTCQAEILVMEDMSSGFVKKTDR